ncbi:NAD(P) transhydrogenase subunit alpha [Mesonia sp. K4-1]|jgi:NAD(P) transhydrogenase subunit alpha|uniref:NAD(P) transhydrogenase subunit alpha n=1 Tax=Mesonia sp. K4-1 TaxID=2602760 RepID=UPI0011CC673D|nr:NAD(P) transhydrogenase subunit alpha [Mesonia sp. K4-1]TXK76205.1 NAD(P) transhydrogenase subunit alpha [Mesonia sp. K4-1]
MEFLQNNLEAIYIVLLCIFIGIEVLSNVPSVLHTPLMSGANAISGVITIGAIAIVLNLPEDAHIGILILGGIAVFLGTLNIAGGFLVTRRMLRMFTTKSN